MPRKLAEDLPESKGCVETLKSLPGKQQLLLLEIGSMVAPIGGDGSAREHNCHAEVVDVQPILNYATKRYRST